MRKWSRYLVGVVAVTGLFVLVTQAGAETCTLEMKKVDTSPGASRSGLPVDYLFRSTYPQRFFQQLGGPQGRIVRPGKEEKPEFSAVVKKEPAEYAMETPFRGVVALGSGHYGFVLDIAAPKEEEKEKADGEDKTAEAKEEEAEDKGSILSMLAKALAIPLAPESRPETKAPHFTRLYFDRNHNGDLTDDEVIEAKTEQSRPSSTNHASFPTVKLTIDVDGKKVDYAFMFSVYSYGSGTYSYANASLNAAAYRDGEITLDGVKHRVVLVDFNSNGRFDDVGGVNDKVQLSDGTVYPKMGDMLYIDPQPSVGYRNPYDSTGSKDQYQVNKLIAFGDRFYDLKIDPSGKTLALEPSSTPVGYITNPNKGFRAIIYGDQGILEIDDSGTGKTPVPEGEWKLMSYTLERSETAEPEADEEKKEEGSLLELLGSALSTPVRRPTPPRRTVVSARAKRDFEAVKVVEGETAEMRFGPPYIPKVETRNLRKGMSKASLSMSLVGTGGEVCSNLLVKGNRPGAPEFTISTKDGEEVAAGKFKYG
jgi:hypothetical protein